MHDVIYSRDALDRLVDQWAGDRPPDLVPGLGAQGVLWAVRGVLSGMYRGLNLLHLSLSRQMEYNADNVAVSVTGSDALIHGLARLEFASECPGRRRPVARRRRRPRAVHRRPVPPPDPVRRPPSPASARTTGSADRRSCRTTRPSQVTVFEPIDDGVPEKYRSHPTDHMRERNAKRFYVRSPRDDRSPWLLFGDAAGLKREATGHFYRHALGRQEAYDPRPAAEVQAFIDAEHAETTYDPRYHGLVRRPVPRTPATSGPARPAPWAAGRADDLVGRLAAGRPRGAGSGVPAAPVGGPPAARAEVRRVEA